VVGVDLNGGIESGEDKKGVESKIDVMVEHNGKVKEK